MLPLYSAVLHTYVTVPDTLPVMLDTFLAALKQSLSARLQLLEQGLYHSALYSHDNCSVQLCALTDNHILVVLAPASAAVHHACV